MAPAIAPTNATPTSMVMSMSRALAANVKGSSMESCTSDGDWSDDWREHEDVPVDGAKASTETSCVIATHSKTDTRISLSFIMVQMGL